MLYGKLDKELSEELHYKPGYKFWNFSNLILHDRRKNPKGLDFDSAHFVLSSPDKEFVRGFAEGLLGAPEFRLDSVDFVVERMEILPKREFSDRCRLRTLSPIYIKTQRKENGEFKEHDLYPQDGKFYENLHKNLVSRYEEFYNKELKDDFFEIVKLWNFKGKRVGVDGSFRRCSLFNFELNANSELIEFGYYAGFGEKTGMGFGSVEVEG